MLPPAYARSSRLALGSPMFAWIALLTVFPLAFSLAMSFFDYRLGSGGTFAGLSNYIRLLGDYRFWSSFGVTLSFAVLATLLETGLGLVIAVVLFEFQVAGDRWRALIALPLFMAPVALGYLGITVFHEEVGPVNLAFRYFFGIQLPWLSHGTLAFVSVLLIDVWEWTPFCFLVLYAALLAIPADLFEAARMEPLTAFGRVWHLLVPILRPTLALAALIRFVESLKLMDIPFSLTAGGPGLATETLSLYTYKTCMKFFDFGYGSALGYALFALVMVVCQMLARWTLRRATT